MNLPAFLQETLSSYCSSAIRGDLRYIRTSVYDNAKWSRAYLFFWEWPAPWLLHHRRPMGENMEYFTVWKASVRLER